MLNKMAEEKKIRLKLLRLIYSLQGIPYTTRRIANEIKITWERANKLLNALFDEGYLKRARTQKGTTYWAVND